MTVSNAVTAVQGLVDALRLAQTQNDGWHAYNKEIRELVQASDVLTSDGSREDTKSAVERVVKERDTLKAELAQLKAPLVGREAWGRVLFDETPGREGVELPAWSDTRVRRDAICGTAERFAQRLLAAVEVTANALLTDGWCRTRSQDPDDARSVLRAALTHARAALGVPAVQDTAEPPKYVAPAFGVGLGLFELRWKSGGISNAAVGNDRAGRRWYAPSNWIGGVPCFDWSEVISVKRIAECGHIVEAARAEAAQGTAELASEGQHLALRHERNSLNQQLTQRNARVAELERELAKARKPTAAAQDARVAELEAECSRLADKYSAACAAASKAIDERCAAQDDCKSLAGEVARLKRDVQAALDNVDIAFVSARRPKLRRHSCAVNSPPCARRCRAWPTFDAN